jgi:hypothetical protein
MRADRNNYRQVYQNYWDWLRTGTNYIWIIALIFGYAYYLGTTEEVG